MYRMLEYRTKRYLKYQNIHILLFLLRRFSQSLASQYGKPFLLKGNFINTLPKLIPNYVFHCISLHQPTVSASNSPQRLLPLINTVTTATTSKSGSREPDLFFSLLLLKQNTLYYFSFLPLNY